MKPQMPRKGAFLCDCTGHSYYSRRKKVPDIKYPQRGKSEGKEEETTEHLINELSHTLHYGSIK